MARAYLGIGSNLDDRLALLQGAVDGLRATDSVTVVAISSVYETGPVGGPEQGRYLNAVIAMDTTGDPWALLAVAQQLETAANRVRVERWGPRTLDVDVLLFDSVTMDDPLLTIPHPRMHERAFVLVPLADVAPDLVPEVPVDPSVVRYSEVLH